MLSFFKQKLFLFFFFLIQRNKETEKEKLVALTFYALAIKNCVDTFTSPLENMFLFNCSVLIFPDFPHLILSYMAVVAHLK